MNIVLEDGEGLHNKSPVTWCTGYKAKSIVMCKGDFEELRQLAYNDPAKFNAVMLQLDNRFGN